MIGMDRRQGRRIEGETHLAQSIGDILTTPLGTRVMLRDYGSDVPGLIDAPLNGLVLLEFNRAIAEALDRWEPRVSLDRVRVIESGPERVVVELSGIWADRAADAGITIDGAQAQAGEAEVFL